MPALNGRQFRQDPIEGWDQSMPKSMEGYRPLLTDDPDPFDPGPDTKRGNVGEGQRMLNLDTPGKPLETSAGGLVPVDRDSDPTWDNSAWQFGGYNRQVAEDNPSPTATSTEEVDAAHRVTNSWERVAPVETIGPDVEIRTGQGKVARESVIDRKLRPPQVDVDAEQVGELRRSEIFQDETGEEKHPWVAEVEGKRYLMEGHHRAVAARSRGTGEMQAHVLRGGNWGQIEEQMYDQPRQRR